MAATFVQQQHAVDQAASANSITATYDSTPTDGNLLVAVYSSLGGLGAAPTGFSTARTQAQAAANVAIYYKIASSDGTGVTCNTAGGSANQGLSIFEFSSIDGTPLDAVNSAGGSAATSLATGTTGVLAQADEVAFAGLSTQGGITTIAIDSSFTKAYGDESASGGAVGHGSAYLVVSATTALNPTWSWTSARSAAAAIATFKASAVAAAAAPSAVSAGILNRRRMI